MTPSSPRTGLSAGLRSLHGRARGSALLYRLVVGSRVLLAVAFLPTGLVKLLGRPFTRLGPETPIGLFFYALHQTGGYWRFLGGMQMLAAVLLVIPATARFGALVAFPVVLNIVVITTALGFHGTVYLTWPMLLAALLLLAWDYDRWEGVLFQPVPGELAYAAPPPRVPLSAAERLCYGAGLTAGLVTFLGVRGFASPATWIAAGVALLAALGAVVLGLAAAWRAAGSSRGSGPG